MKAKKGPASTEKSELPSPRKKFRIDKLEERIAPKKGGKGTHNCPTQGCGYTDYGGGSIY